MNDVGSMAARLAEERDLRNNGGRSGLESTSGQRVGGNQNQGEESKCSCNNAARDRLYVLRLRHGQQR